MSATPKETDLVRPPVAPRHRILCQLPSLWFYVGSRAFRALTERHGATIIYKPVDLLAVFAAGGGKPVKERPHHRQAYRLVEMRRWRDLRGIPLVLHPKFYPADPSLAHRVLLAALDEGSDVADFVHAIPTPSCTSPMRPAPTAGVFSRAPPQRTCVSARRR